MARKDGKDRGLFEWPKDSGVWGIEYYENGRAIATNRRETAGARCAAKRRTEIREARSFEPSQKRAALFDDLLGIIATGPNVRAKRLSRARMLGAVAPHLRR